jgi:DNA-binding NtrC family response regulator
MCLLRRIVVVGKDSEIQQLARQVGHDIFVADDFAEAFDIVKTVNPDLIVVDDRFNPNHIQEFIGTTDNNSINVPLVVIGSGENNPDISLRFIQVGAYDYLQGKQPQQVGDKLRQIAHQIKNKHVVSLSSPFEINAVEKNISNSFSGSTALTAGFTQDKFFVDECAASVGIAGCSEALVKTLKMIKLVAASRCNPVLIIGETGTGKELVAKAIHTLRHPDERFVAVNCAALTANLLESELFGHVKGSFTGADRDKIGLLELAGSGTIFLDEISEMPLDLQAKLLRVLQERTFRKVGGIKNITCNATIIASSNRNLHKETKANRFRCDLYYRLNVCPVVIASLKSPNRREDIPLLAEYFLRTSAICPDKSRQITSLTKLALEALAEHDWPGNVRELRNVIDRAILFETTDKIGLSSIILNPTECAFTTFAGAEQASQGLPDPPKAGSIPQWRTCSPQRTNIKDFSLAKAERELVARALAETGWQKTQAAALLGITRTTLYAKVKQYNIKRDSQANASGQILDDLQDYELESHTPQTVMVT